jgi:hypothetical protein
MNDNPGWWRGGGAGWPGAPFRKARRIFRPQPTRTAVNYYAGSEATRALARQIANEMMGVGLASGRKPQEIG